MTAAPNPRYARSITLRDFDVRIVAEFRTTSDGAYIYEGQRSRLDDGAPRAAISLSLVGTLAVHPILNILVPTFGTPYYSSFMTWTYDAPCDRPAQVKALFDRFVSLVDTHLSISDLIHMS